MSLIEGFYLGFLIGPQTFRDGPHYTRAKYNIIAQLAVALLCCVGLYVVNVRDNKKRDRNAASLPPQPAGQEFLDLTDGENPYFRYSL
jgi:ACS family allantoate permease-like MFS transporter